MVSKERGNKYRGVGGKIKTVCCKNKIEGESSIKNRYVSCHPVASCNAKGVSSVVETVLDDSRLECIVLRHASSLEHKIDRLFATKKCRSFDYFSKSSSNIDKQREAASDRNHDSNDVNRPNQDVRERMEWHHLQTKWFVPKRSTGSSSPCNYLSYLPKVIDAAWANSSM